ncbi:hypothetical protein CK203_013391 [Vitis vinifera]|uniref:Uncharacterized protein n=1 Tax=Vitis vinifera TaxID=29760 RepID=A0A438JQ70_VITVI|nr:hypothetical protein CK203_013391 [Vitis vinifera]
MATLTILPLLIFFILFPHSSSDPNPTSKTLDSNVSAAHAELSNYGFPVGLLPTNVVDYSINQTSGEFPSISATPANSRSLPTTTWPPTPPRSPARLSMATSPALPALGLGLSSSGGPSLGFVPPAITWSLRLASSRPSTRPRISTRLLFVRGIDRLCNLLSTFTGAFGYFSTGLGCML